MAADPGTFPVYSSAKKNDGKFGEYGQFMFDEELITWSVDGGGRLFHRPKHKYSVTNVGGVLRILDTTRLDYRFLYYVLSLRHSEVMFDWVKKAHPSVIKKLYRDIPVPPLPEQRRIVGILDETFDGIATVKANAEKNLQNARDLFESQLEAVFGHRGEGWMEKTLREAVDARCTLSYGIVQPGDEYPNGLPVVRPTDLTTKMIQLDGLKRIDPRLADAYRRTSLGGGEILLCVRGSTGVVSVASAELAGANVTRGIVPISFNSALLTQGFGYYLMRSGHVQYQIREKTYGAALMQVNIADLRQTVLWFPSLKNQEAITAELETIDAGALRLQSLYRRKLAAFDELKKSLLHQAFTGQL